MYLSSIGIGTYLGNADETTDALYEDAVVRAVQLGANVIDSAANYRFQRSERSIGAALKTLFTEHGFTRDELLICTKGGYLPFDGAPPRDVGEYVFDTFVEPGIASFDDFVGHSHCMTPAYLQNQLDQSLKNLDVSTVDVYYIHNPESQLASFPKPSFIIVSKTLLNVSNRTGTTANCATTASRPGMVFELRPIRLNTIHSNEWSNCSTSWRRDHGFRFIQLPINLAMPEGFDVAERCRSVGRNGDRQCFTFPIAFEPGNCRSIFATRSARSPPTRKRRFSSFARRRELPLLSWA